MGLVRGLATLLFVLALPVALVTTNVRLTVNAPALYEYAFDRYDAEAATGIERGQLDRASADLRAYFNDGRATISTLVMVDGQEEPLYTPQEVAHLADVKDLFRLTFRVQELAVVYALAYVVGVFVWAREATLRSLATNVITSLLVGAGAVAGIGLFAFTGFESSWQQFHEIVFPNDFWLLNPASDHLIQMFPEEFWFDVTLLVGLMTLAESAILGLAAGAYLFFTRGQEDGRAAPSALPQGLSISV